LALTRVWAFAHVLPGAHRRDCNICDGTFIENDVRVGDRVTVKWRLFGLRSKMMCLSGRTRRLP
jgi:hypothetical protein